ncbi:MAG: TSUP family transporter [Actinomycetota bacterium]
MTPIQMVLGTLAVAAGSSLQGLTGFGANLVAVPILLLIDGRFVPGPVVVAGTVLNILASLRARSSDIHPLVRLTILGQLPGAIFAASVLVAMPQRALVLVFSASVLGAALASASGWRPVFNTGTLLASGAASGFFGTLAGIGGPPVALMFQDESGPVLRATMARHFLAGALISMPALALVGRLGPQDLMIALSLLPGTFVGFALSGRLTRTTDRRSVRPLVIGLSAVSAIAVAVRELF